MDFDNNARRKPMKDSAFLTLYLKDDKHSLFGRCKTNNTKQIGKKYLTGNIFMYNTRLRNTSVNTTCILVNAYANLRDLIKSVTLSNTLDFLLVLLFPFPIVLIAPL